MNNYEQLKKQLDDINTKRVKFQTLKEQAQNECKRIEQKYGVNSVEELQELYKKTQEEYNIIMEEAKSYIQKANETFNQYQGIL